MNLQDTSLFDVFRTGLKHILQQDKQQDSAFKVIGNHWIARYSNAFKDRENEFFPVKAIDQYIERVDKGLTPMPELWVWHTPKAVGETKVLARVGNFVIAAGTFTDDKFGQLTKEWLSNNKAKNSHGFAFDVENFKDNSYHDFNTFEITILPFGKGVEANAYTNIEVKDMSTINENKRAFLEELFGKDAAAEFIAETEKADKAIQELGVEFKDFTHIDDKADGEGDNQDPKKKKPQDGEEDMNPEDMPMKKTATLIGDIIKDNAELAQGQLKLLKIAKAQQKTIDTLTQELDSVRKEFALPTTQASQDASTVINEKMLENDELLGKLVKALKDKEAKDHDPVADFWADAVEES